MITITSKKILNEGNSEVNTYGLKTETGFAIEDVCTVEHELQQFVDKINELEVSELHLWDVVEDFLLER